LNCRILCETFPARLERGAGRPPLERLPYFPEQAAELLAQFDAIVIAGASRPVAFFGYPGRPSQLLPQGARCEILAAPTESVAPALAWLAESLGASSASPRTHSLARPPKPTGALSAMTIGQAIAAMMPEHAIVVDEAATTGLPFFAAAAKAPPHSYLSLTGGAIGQGLPCATGAALACPERWVIAFEADGSAMYTLQALWTQAREGLNVTTLLCNNRSYRILQVELHRSGITTPGSVAKALTSLSHPEIDWVGAARAMGVPAVRVDTADALGAELGRALAAGGPNLIEMIL